MLNFDQRSTQTLFWYFIEISFWSKTLNEVALIQVARKRVGFQDRKNENTSKFPSIKNVILSSILTILKNNLSHL